jgi:hypothetical protein
MPASSRACISCIKRNSSGPIEQKSVSIDRLSVLHGNATFSMTSILHVAGQLYVAQQNATLSTTPCRFQHNNTLLNIDPALAHIHMRSKLASCPAVSILLIVEAVSYLQTLLISLAPCPTRLVKKYPSSAPHLIQEAVSLSVKLGMEDPSQGFGRYSGRHMIHFQSDNLAVSDTKSVQPLEARNRISFLFTVIY